MTVLQTDPLTVWVLRDLHMTRTPHPTGGWASYRLNRWWIPRGSPLPYGVSYDPYFRLDLNQRPLPCEGSALTNCATEAMTKPCDLIWVIECIIHSPELPHLDLNQDEQIQSLSCLPSYIMGQ